MSIVKWVQIRCDGCGFTSHDLHSLEEADDYVNHGIDGEWYTGDREICWSCVHERACRIFGHTQPSPIDGACYRCDEVLV